MRPKVIKKADIKKAPPKDKHKADLQDLYRRLGALMALVKEKIKEVDNQ